MRFTLSIAVLPVVDSHLEDKASASSDQNFEEFLTRLSDSS